MCYNYISPYLRDHMGDLSIKLTFGTDFFFFKEEAERGRNV